MQSCDQKKLKQVIEELKTNEKTGKEKKQKE